MFHLVFTSVIVTFQKMNNGKTSTQGSEVLESSQEAALVLALVVSTYKDKDKPGGGGGARL